MSSRRGAHPNTGADSDQSAARTKDKSISRKDTHTRSETPLATSDHKMVRPTENDGSSWLETVGFLGRDRQMSFDELRSQTSKDKVEASCSEEETSAQFSNRNARTGLQAGGKWRGVKSD